MNFFSAYTLKVKTQTLIFLKYEAFLVICGITELRKKEVINIRNGLRLGFVSDVEIDLCNARIVSIIIYGKLKFFGIFGRHQDIVIKWEIVNIMTMMICTVLAMVCVVAVDVINYDKEVS